MTPIKIESLIVTSYMPSSTDEQFLVYNIQIPLDYWLLKSFGWRYYSGLNRLVSILDTMAVYDLSQKEIEQGWISLLTLQMLERALWTREGREQQRRDTREALGL